MLALRLSRGARPAVQLRRLLVAAASAGTGFLLLCALGYAMSHPESPAEASLRLVWCLPPLASTIHFAAAVARTDPGTRPRPGLDAVGLGPLRLTLLSAATTALACALGSMLALLVFLHLRGDLTGMPFDGAAAASLAADSPLPLPAALTLLALVPVTASAAVAVVLRPGEPVAARTGAAGPLPRVGGHDRPGRRETFGAYGRFGARRRRGEPAAAEVNGAAPAGEAPADALTADGRSPDRPEEESARLPGPVPPRPAPRGLPWGVAVLAAGLAVESYAARAGDGGPVLPAALPTGPTGVLAGWLLTALGLALAAPGLTHLCGRLVQAVRPGPLRLLAGRGLMAEATRIGRPLGVVCAVASAAYASALVSGDAASAAFGPLSTLGAVVVIGCAVATLLTAAVEARQDRADTTAALLRLGAPTATLRNAAVLRACALLLLFVPLTLAVAHLAALPLAR
ncbi:hypothetical protein SZN_08486 [Streptomyces zinciresistens K42]|uniref:Uncharacterized protein n=1 Tax=Streptomyces zinciresistens K42 TaxID=700597 RepID=G2G883_9ACTN|nr:hypothetical protein [Streptomyces zinciresistens]EGX60233.1 hypothetical protein SZN_08486 [Streptomyces zinciresistens K42]